jgi:hypothetical protein
VSTCLNDLQTALFESYIAPKLISHRGLDILLLSVLCCPNSDGTPNTSPAGTRLAASGGIPRGMRTVFFVLLGILCLSEC